MAQFNGAGMGLAPPKSSDSEIWSGKTVAKNKHFWPTYSSASKFFSYVKNIHSPGEANQVDSHPKYTNTIKKLRYLLAHSDDSIYTDVTMRARQNVSNFLF